MESLVQAWPPVLEFPRSGLCSNKADFFSEFVDFVSLDPVWPLIKQESSSEVVDQGMEPGLGVGVGMWGCVQSRIVRKVFKGSCRW